MSANDNNIMRPSNKYSVLPIEQAPDGDQAMLPIDATPPTIQPGQNTPYTNEGEQAPPPQASSAIGIQRSVWMAPLPPHIKFQKNSEATGTLTAPCKRHLLTLW